MIRAYVNMYDGKGNCDTFRFDATPWFEQASEQQLARLEQERDQSIYHGKPYVFYAGVQTDDIWSWLLLKIKDKPEVRQFMGDYDTDDSFTWSVEIIGEDVDKYFTQKKATKAATDAVDILLKGRGIGEGEEVDSDNLAQDVVHGILSDPYHKARMAWRRGAPSHNSHITRYAWEEALKVLGYVESASMKEIAFKLESAQAEFKAVSNRSEKSVNDYLLYVVEPACTRFGMSREDTEVIKRLWRTVALQ